MKTKLFVIQKLEIVDFNSTMSVEGKAYTKINEAKARIKELYKAARKDVENEIEEGYWCDEPSSDGMSFELFEDGRAPENLISASIEIVEVEL